MYGPGAIAAAEAASEATELSDAHQDLISGVVECAQEKRFTVYRPERGATVDQRMTKIATKHGVQVRFELTKYARSDIERIRGEIRSRSAELKAQGAELYSLAGNVDGPVWVVVGVLANPDATRKVLADFGPDIRVEKVTRNVPL